MKTLSLSVENSFTKTECQQYAETLISEVTEGNTSAINLLVQLESLSQVIEQTKSKVREMAVDEVEAYGSEAKNGVNVLGATLKLKEAGVRYDYSVCNHPRWNALKETIDAQTEEKKEVEKMLYSLKETMTILDEESGEVIRVIPPTKSSKTTVEIALSK